MTIVYIIALCTYLITCSGYYKLTMAEPSLQECSNEHPRFTVLSMVVCSLLWPVVCLMVYFVAGLKNK